MLSIQIRLNLKYEERILLLVVVPNKVSEYYELHLK